MSRKSRQLMFEELTTFPLQNHTDTSNNPNSANRVTIPYRQWRQHFLDFIDKLLLTSTHYADILSNHFATCYFVVLSVIKTLFSTFNDDPVQPLVFLGNRMVPAVISICFIEAQKQKNGPPMVTYWSPLGNLLPFSKPVARNVIKILFSAAYCFHPTDLLQQIFIFQARISVFERQHTCSRSPQLPRLYNTVQQHTFLTR